jgi:cytochrome P450
MYVSTGPVIRMSPTEIHVSDPNFYNVLYAGGSQRRHKDLFVLGGFYCPDSGFCTRDHDLHRMRRLALNPFFSKQAVQRLEPMIQSKIDLLCNRLREFAQQGQVLTVGNAMMALTTDIISEYSFGYSFNALEQEDLAASWNGSFREAMASSVWFRYRYLLQLGRIMTSLPFRIAKIVSPSLVPAVTIMNVRLSSTPLI